MEPGDLKSDFWTHRYKSRQTGWDVGYPTSPITTYFDGVENRLAKILIPGCGRAWEGEYLFRNGFKNLYLLDGSDAPKAEFLQRVPEFPENQFITCNFFDHQGSYDFVVEQTFFCALHPSLRNKYAQKMSTLLPTNGILTGLLFQDRLFDEHPPYGGFKVDYTPIFEPFFEFLHFETAYNSIKPRAEREYFIEFRRK